MSKKRDPAAEILQSLTSAVLALKQPSTSASRDKAIAQTLRVLAELLVAPINYKAAEPHYGAVEDYRGTPFGPGAPIPYRRGSALYRALAIFRDCSNPITEARFIELGGRSKDLERLVLNGKVVRLGD